MRHFAFPRITRTTLGPLLAVVFWAVLPAISSASCGDWLVGSARHLNDGRLSATPFDRPIKASETVNGLSRQTQPCDGPHCDRRPNDLPSVPPAPSIEPPPHQPAWLSLVDNLIPDSRDRSDLADPLAPGRYFPFVPDRPPRD